MAIRLVTTLLIGLTLIPDVNAKAPQYIGVVALVENIVATGVSETDKIFKIGDRVFINQKIKTLMNSRAQIIFRDQSVLNIGPDTEISIKTYNWRSDRPSFAAQVRSGAIRFKSGTFPSGSYTVSSPSALVKLQGTQVDFLVSRPGATEILLRSGAASVTPNSSPTQGSSDTLASSTGSVILNSPNSFVQMDGSNGISGQPKVASISKQGFYDSAFDINIGDNDQITGISRDRINAELQLASLETGNPVTKAQIDAELFLRGIDRSAALTAFINKKLKNCSGGSCRVLLNKRRLVNQAIRKLKRQRTALLKNFGQGKGNADALARIRQLLSGALAEETRLRQIEVSALKAVTDATNNQRSAKKTLKKKQKSVGLKTKKRAFNEARKKFRQAKTDDEKKAARAALKSAKTTFDTAKAAVALESKAFKDAKSNLKNLQKAAKDASSAAEDAAKDVKALQAQLNSNRALRRLKRAKRRPIEAAQPQQRSVKTGGPATNTRKIAVARPSGISKQTKAANKKAKAAAKTAARQAKAANKKAKAAAKKAAKQAKAATKKAKAAAKKAAKQAKAAAKKAAKQAKAARKAAARARKAALRKARREAANN